MQRGTGGPSEPDGGPKGTARGDWHLTFQVDHTHLPGQLWEPTRVGMAVSWPGGSSSDTSCVNISKTPQVFRRQSSLPAFR